jgi:hypothetical protein
MGIGTVIPSLPRTVKMVDSTRESIRTTGRCLSHQDTTAKTDQIKQSLCPIPVMTTHKTKR